ncbi:MAG TPA: DUF885 domain-containing protein [Gemmatimonadaceae bacterium]
MTARHAAVTLLGLSLLLGAVNVNVRAQSEAPRPDFHARFVELEARRATSDSARLHALFALDWEYTNVDAPELATVVGYPGQDGRWTDYSLAAIRRRREELADRLLVLRAIDRTRLNDADQLSFDVFARGARENVEGTRFPSELLAVTQREGPQFASGVIARMPTVTTADYEHVVARLAGIPRLIDQTLVLLDSGARIGVTPPRVTLRNVPAQIEGLVPDAPMRSPLLLPFTHMPSTIPQADRERLTEQAIREYTERVRPAYHRLESYLTTSYIPNTRTTLGWSGLPDGRAWYAYHVKVETTTDRTPREIHRIGLSEVRRIRAQMDSAMRAAGYTGDLSSFVAMLRTDSRFFMKDSASLVRSYREIAQRIDPQLPKLFRRTPRLPYEIATVPSYAAPSQPTAYYESGSPDAHRPGILYVNTYRLDARPTWEMEALAAHELVPGHHLEVALSQELEALPEFRRYGGYTAFTEGWALYAERLGGDLGLYRDPYSRFGQLSYEMWRAIRLVLDTGIHDMGWSREQAIAYFRANSAKSDQEIAAEVDRYVVMPGQALAYKSGELAITSLRAEAERALGPRFDVRDFHAAVLSQGAIPLDVLEARMHRWISEQEGWN